MKKLRDATTVEMKKTVVAISKGVVAISKGKRNDVVKRDPLPKYVFTNIIPTVDELKCLQLPNNDGMDLKDSINSTLPSTSSSQHIKVDQKAKMIASSLLLDDFDDFTTLPPLRLLTRLKSKSDILLAPPSKRRKTDAERTESVDKRFNDIEALMKKHHEEMKKQHEEMMLDLKEKYDAPQKVVIEIDSSNKDVEKNETHFDDLGTLNEHLKNVPEKESETEVKNVAFEHTIDNTITDFSSLVSAIQSEELLQKENLPDLILPTKNTEVLNELLNAYTDKMSKVAGDLNETPFDVEYIKDISQQVSGSLDCGVFVAAYAEFLSNQMQIPSSNLDTEYLRKIYASLLWNYGVKKANKIYSSGHDNPLRHDHFMSLRLTSLIF
ncbi:hypothetical protein T459_28193 [Capsicum annuum]|uniref:Ubiquitin-like protease family profile domain-containing protein n=1 Tax=Capsicum annuum TaxID=4072 RepID=A0A2G2YG31_CAPAN|nr:hypothetical protein T459_28193 [Capsicum annuum]